MTACNVKDAQAGRRAKQVKQGHRHFVIRGIESGNVEVCHSVVPGMCHVLTVMSWLFPAATIRGERTPVQLRQ
jgi:hypothetical protein